MAKRR